MIVKAFLAILQWISNLVFSILPSFPVLPSFIPEALEFLSNLMVSAAGILKYILGATLYNAFLDFIVIMYGWKMFLNVFNFIKKYILMR